jgi:hypothetical protein
MAANQKINPRGTPSVPAELAQTIQDAIASKERASDVMIRMTIEGGQAEERYRFHFEASGQGALSSHLSCRMTGREAHSKAGVLSHTEFAGLLRAADVAALVETKRPLVRIPPCSLLGRVEIVGGAQKMTFVFMADPGQAAQAGMEPPPALARLVDKIFDVSAAHMDVKAARSLRP